MINFLVDALIICVGGGEIEAKKSETFLHTHKKNWRGIPKKKKQRGSSVLAIYRKEFSLYIMFVVVQFTWRINQQTSIKTIQMEKY